MLMFAVVTTVGCGGGKGPSEREGRVVLDVASQLGAHAWIYLERATEYHGRYYCVFSHDCLFPKEDGQFFLAIDKGSHEVTQLPWPKEATSYYDDLFVRHDTLFLDLYGSWEEYDFYFDSKTSQWVACPELDDLVYEDADYRVYMMDHGEFGEVMWFEERRSGHEYGLLGIGDVRRVGDTFFVVSPYVVLGITTGQLAAMPPSMTDHRRVEKEDYYIASYYHKVSWIKGDTVYRHRHYTGWEEWTGERYDTVITGSVVSGDSLLLVVDKPDGTALMRIEGGAGKMSAVQEHSAGRLPAERLRTVRPLGERYHTSRHAHSGRDMIQIDRLLMPFQRDVFTMGLLDIEGDRVEVIEIGHNIDTLVPQPSDGLETMLVYLRDHWNDLTDSVICRFEQSLGGCLLGPESIERNGYFMDAGFREGHHIEYYYKLVDTLYCLETEYCVHDGDGRVKALFMDVSEPMPYHKGNLHYYYERRKEFERQVHERMLSRLDALCGAHRSRGDEFLWRFGPLTITCYSRDNRMLIY